MPRLRRLMVGAAYNSYVKEVLSPLAGPTQRTETRRAFYAGAIGVLTEIMTVLGPDDGVDHLTPEQEAHLMEDLQKELTDFALDLKEGRA